MERPGQGSTLTAREAAAALGVAEGTVYRYVREGLLDADERPAGLSRRLTITAQAVERCRERLRQAHAHARDGE